MNGQIAAFVAGVGSGGTLQGVGQFLRERKPGVRIVAVEPKNVSALLGHEPGLHQIQGIGDGFIPAVLDVKLVDEVIQGVSAVVKSIRTRLPQSKLLLLAIFPRGAVDAPQRDQIREINTALAKLDDGKMIKFLDIGKVFLAPDGSIPKTIMPDLLHPNAAGYQRWADAMEPTLAGMLN